MPKVLSPSLMLQNRLLACHLLFFLSHCSFELVSTELSLSIAKLESSMENYFGRPKFGYKSREFIFSTEDYLFMIEYVHIVSTQLYVGGSARESCRQFNIHKSDLLNNFAGCAIFYEIWYCSCISHNICQA